MEIVFLEPSQTKSIMGINPIICLLGKPVWIIYNLRKNSLYNLLLEGNSALTITLIRNVRMEYGVMILNFKQ